MRVNSIIEKKTYLAVHVLNHNSPFSYKPSSTRQYFRNISEMTRHITWVISTECKSTCLSRHVEYHFYTAPIKNFCSIAPTGVMCNINNISD